MNEILKKRRVSKTVERVVKERKAVLNPEYNEYKHIRAQTNYDWYEHDKYVYVEMPILKKVKTTHIEYQINCRQCGTKVWVRRTDAYYCSASCRKEGYLARKQAEKEAAKEKTPTP